MAGVQVARAHALAVLRIRGTALGIALLPAAFAVVLLVGGATGWIGGSDQGGWTAFRWAVVGSALVVLVLAGSVAAVLVRARPAQSPTVPVDERAAPELYRMVRELAERLDVPAPSVVALTPDCDSWLEVRPDRRRPPGRPPHRGAEPATLVLVIGSPFLWWMRVAELRALLAPVVAGTGPSADPDVAAARRFVRGLDAAVAISASPPPGAVPGAVWAAPLRRPAFALLGAVARVLLRSCRDRASEMERAVASWASERAQQVDYGLRIVAQEQVGLAYAGWDRLLTRVALPAWRSGRWPSRLNAGVVAALTELSRRDRLAEGYESRLGERPACDLLEDPGTVDQEVSLLAARLFHGGPPSPGPHWSPVGWDEYPQQVVDRIWRGGAARLHRVLDELGPAPRDDAGATVARVLDRLAQGGGEPLAARLVAALSREDCDHGPDAPQAQLAPTPGDGQGVYLPVYQLQPARTARDLLIEHVTAMVCCAAVDTAGARPGLDWLDGPALLVGGARRADFASPVIRLVEGGDPAPLRTWLANAGVRLEKPVHLG
ncbi:hypothetical protein AQ490_04225 [Wenjunlia vitaminophila]|uniref:Uncharacterized protein n=1 Tax=Wenjunlia vitaminophila TaxID=76728 RepID=A0A0T6LRJ3_WENVI|nr:hypothetical protein [Wenjunlia vitaminophila]KRV48463.1 hypothetical protein AQ490_04225 [Wenjunlia vitaminophila]